MVSSKPRKVTRAYSDYLFGYLDLRKNGELSGAEVAFLDTWWVRPKRKKRGKQPDRVLRDPRRAIEAMKKKREEERLQNDSERLQQSPLLKPAPFVKSTKDTPDPAQLTQTLKSHWNPRHHQLDNSSNKIDQLLFELNHVDRGSDKMKQRVQQKADQTNVLSWVQSALGNQLPDRSSTASNKPKGAYLAAITGEPRPPPIRKTREGDE